MLFEQKYWKFRK